eukprot:m.143372 g.143372  ORF g.143372 m.143372 type:complete len:84 (-) comp17696_c0_seq3:1051-1302(-)
MDTSPYGSPRYSRANSGHSELCFGTGKAKCMLELSTTLEHACAVPGNDCMLVRALCDYTSRTIHPHGMKLRVPSRVYPTLNGG